MWRSMLYVPGVDERKLRKSTTIEADAVIIDLEDSVPQGRKEEARRLVETLLGELEWGSDVCVRINNPASREGLRDLAAVTRWETVSCLLVPKAEARLDQVYGATGKSLVAIVETARGLLRVEEVASSEGLVALNWGPADLAASLGASVDPLDSGIYTPILRLTIAAAARAYGLEPLDKVYFKVGDLEGLGRECLEAKALGYSGKTVIHPSHVPIANEAFTPTKEEVERARLVVEAYEDAVRRGLGAVALEGELVDAVHYRLALNVLRRASRIGKVEESMRRENRGEGQA
ncbi:HpcH/HpaI aldolase/citrate lyase family protein [Aeropyrum camini]|uniref:Malyl-CoA lyase n=1 Tax=Aeropyrum camini SY1 = JCM 12091 TaxID=1198449 RepID=U3TCM0_9CREN|nr:CoA ester lyase [Aeropyrum camini]BAN89703.1 malyl-CoA lyase [Aeropyrum camini SY1 = JCM 12091]